MTKFTPQSARTPSTADSSREPVPLCPPLLLALPASQKSQISASLANDENSTDAELVDFWTEECGIATEAATMALAYRSRFFEDPFFELFPSE